MSNTPTEPRPALITGSGSQTVAPGLHILHGQGQSFLAETDVGLVLVDAGPGGKPTQSLIDGLRKISDAPLHAICYSHGHIGYNAGVPQWLDHARERGDPVPRLIAHRNLPRRYARYRETRALQERMAEVQFNRPAGSLDRALYMHDPTETFDDRLVIGHGDTRVELLWAPSETDDAIAVWHPGQRVLYGGPSMIDSIPNIGTPFRTLRDTVRWADTLDALAQLRPVKVVREFGPTIEGEAESQHVFTHTTKALRWVRAEVVRLMNEGMNEGQVLAAIRFPEDLFGVPWMRPTYGDPSFIARDVYRSENGWWDRNPTNLHPAPPDEAAVALAEAIADKPALMARAQAWADKGQWQLALHVIDALALAPGDAPEFVQARALKAAWMRERAQQVRSFVSSNLYRVSADLIERGEQARYGIR